MQLLLVGYLQKSNPLIVVAHLLNSISWSIDARLQVGKNEMLAFFLIDNNMEIPFYLDVCVEFAVWNCVNNWI